MSLDKKYRPPWSKEEFFPSRAEIIACVSIAESAAAAVVAVVKAEDAVEEENFDDYRNPGRRKKFRQRD
jgi:hypothetical protein